MAVHSLLQQWPVISLSQVCSSHSTVNVINDSSFLSGLMCFFLILAWGQNSTGDNRAEEPVRMIKDMLSSILWRNFFPYCSRQIPKKFNDAVKILICHTYSLTKVVRWTENIVAMNPVVKSVYQTNGRSPMLWNNRSIKQAIRSVERGICPIAEFTSPWLNCAGWQTDWRKPILISVPCYML